jgi:2-methylcitrate dehydratase PrpD
MAFIYPHLSTPSASSQLASFISELTFSDIPSKIVEKAKATLLDTFGCAIAGIDSEATRAALTVIRALGGTPDSTILGYAEKTSSTNAAFVNAIMAKCYDFDGPQIGGHGSPIMIPVSLALVERAHLSGQDLITSIVAGVEVMGRVAQALGPEHQVLHGFHRTATSGVFGAVATAGKLLNLGKKQLTHAIGIAGSCVGGTEAYLQAGGAWTNSFHCGKPAFDGILSALLAQQGFTGPTWILEGVDGVLQTHAPQGTADPASLIEGLSEKWYFGEALNGFKRYASCGSMHPCLTAFQTLAQKHCIHPDDVREITIWSSFANYKFNCTPRTSKLAPQSIIEGIFSLPFCLGLLAYRNAITPKQWSEPTILNDAKILSLAQKVHCLVNYDTPEVRVDIRTQNSSYSICGVFIPSFTLTEIEQKFLTNNAFSSHLSDDEAAALMQSIKTIDRANDLSEILSLLSKRSLTPGTD